MGIIYPVTYWRLKMIDITMAEICTQLDQNNPRWMFDLADMTDLRDALNAKCRNPEFDVSEFLADRLQGRIHQVAQAVFACYWREATK